MTDLYRFVVSDEDQHRIAEFNTTDPEPLRGDVIRLQYNADYDAVEVLSVIWSVDNGLNLVKLKVKPGR